MSPVHAESEPFSDSEKDVGVPNGADDVGVLVEVLSPLPELVEVDDSSSPELLRRQLSCTTNSLPNVDATRHHSATLGKDFERTQGKGAVGHTYSSVASTVPNTAPSTIAITTTTATPTAIHIFLFVQNRFAPASLGPGASPSYGGAPPR